VCARGALHSCPMHHGSDDLHGCGHDMRCGGHESGRDRVRRGRLLQRYVLALLGRERLHGGGLVRASDGRLLYGCTGLHRGWQCAERHRLRRKPLLQRGELRQVHERRRLRSFRKPVSHGYGSLCRRRHRLHGYRLQRGRRHFVRQQPGVLGRNLRRLHGGSILPAGRQRVSERYDVMRDGRVHVHERHQRRQWDAVRHGRSVQRRRVRRVRDGSGVLSGQQPVSDRRDLVHERHCNMHADGSGAGWNGVWKQRRLQRRAVWGLHRGGFLQPEWQCLPVRYDVMRDRVDDLRRRNERAQRHDMRLQRRLLQWGVLALHRRYAVHPRHPREPLSDGDDLVLHGAAHVPGDRQRGERDGVRHR
jgi:hypothetical protein